VKNTVPWDVMLRILVEINGLYEDLAATIFIAVNPEDGENRFVEKFERFPPDDVE
jgi:hypothetical protein